VSTAITYPAEFIQMMSTPVPAGFAALYDKHYAAVYHAALRVTGNRADAEDVLQTVFLRVLARVDDEELATRPTAYFRRAAVNAAVDLLRRRAVHAEAPFDEDSAGPGVEHAGLLKERLRRAVAALPAEDATLFLLRHVEGLTIAELAELVGIEKNNVSVRLHRIRLRLQTEMDR
jgi:RNA polymerase sigma factor (sigma-70 family)